MEAILIVLLTGIPWRAKYNGVRLHGGIGWKTPAEVYHDEALMSRTGLRASRTRSDLLSS
jgi:hypothetical protein